jgi:hypothetical protein
MHRHCGGWPGPLIRPGLACQAPASLSCFCPPQLSVPSRRGILAFFKAQVKSCFSGRWAQTAECCGLPQPSVRKDASPEREGTLSLDWSCHSDPAAGGRRISISRFIGITPDASLAGRGPSGRAAPKLAGRRSTMPTGIRLPTRPPSVSKVITKRDYLHRTDSFSSVRDGPASDFPAKRGNYPLAARGFCPFS